MNKLVPIRVLIRTHVYILRSRNHVWISGKAYIFRKDFFFSKSAENINRTLFEYSLRINTEENPQKSFIFL